MVTVEEKNYPDLASIQISLDNANAGERPPPRPSPPVGAVEPGLQVENFSISGQPILVQRAKVNLSCTARDVRLGQGRDKEGNVLLVLQDAAEGNVEVDVALGDLEAIVLAGAKAEAAKQSVTVENVRIELRSRSERALDVVLHVRAKKLFLTAAVRINGSVAIDEQLNARFSGLECEGEGTLGTLACGFIAPQLERFDGREFSLLALPLGEVKLREVRIAAGRELRVTAQFGRAA
ncbi:MAG: hypothetical protein H0T83_06815 [Chthoniobacterales bacterium]|nr:hypothetical protein [Chthoniobacterales bacterium]